MATFTYESLKYALKNPTIKGSLSLTDDGGDFYIGADNDLHITHTGSAGTIDCNTGNLELQVDGSAVINLKDEDGDTMASFTSNGASVLYYNNTAAVSTVSGGTSLTGTLAVSGNTTLTGNITANAGVIVDNITIDGTEIDLSSGDLTLDVAGDIVLDADGADIKLQDGGTDFGSLTNSSSNLIIKSGTTTAATFSGANVTFAGTIGSGAITSTAGLAGTTLVMSSTGSFGGNLTVTGSITASADITAYSDMNLKSDIKTIPNALDKVSDLRGVYYTREGEAGTGVIAQEVENILPEVVKDGEYKSVAYGNMVGILIEAIKELKKEVEVLKEAK